MNGYTGSNTEQARNRQDVASNITSAITQRPKTISGKILSQEDKKGIPGVRVQIKGTDIETRTSANGSFILQRVQPGTFTLLVRSIGTKPKEIPVTVENQQNTIVPDIEIESIYESIEGTPIEIDDSPEFAEAKKDVSKLNTSIREVLGNQLDILTEERDVALRDNILTELSNTPQNWGDLLTQNQNIRELLTNVIETLRRLGGQTPDKKTEYDNIINQLTQKNSTLQTVYNTNTSRISLEKPSVEPTQQRIQRTAQGLEEVTISGTQPQLSPLVPRAPIAQPLEPQVITAVKPPTEAPAPTVKSITIADFIERTTQQYPESGGLINKIGMRAAVKAMGLRTDTPISETTTRNGRTTSISPSDLLERIRTKVPGGASLAPVAENILQTWGVMPSTSSEDLINKQPISPEITPSRQPTIETSPSTTASATPIESSGRLAEARRQQESAQRPVIINNAPRQAPMVMPAPQSQAVPQSSGSSRANISFPVRHISNSYERNMLMNLGRAFGYQ